MFDSNTTRHRCNRLTQSRGLRDFSGLVLDAQQKDRELATLDIKSARLSHKVRA